jgi:hypothetical protein
MTIWVSERIHSPTFKACVGAEAVEMFVGGGKKMAVRCEVTE